jgi:dUTP pyrophosphatase
MSINVQIKKLDHAKDLNLPTYATEQSAGMDLLAAVDTQVILKPRERKIIPTGIVICLPIGYEGQIRPRSGLAIKHGITSANSPGTIDSDYRGEVGVILINHGQEDFIIERGMRIAQMVVAKHEHVIWQEQKELDSTARGEGGFGSTGHK